jgi:hypothetical protein
MFGQEQASLCRVCVVCHYLKAASESDRVWDRYYYHASYHDHFNRGNDLHARDPYDHTLFDYRGHTAKHLSNCASTAARLADNTAATPKSCRKALFLRMIALDCMGCGNAGDTGLVMANGIK